MTDEIIKYKMVFPVEKVPIAEVYPYPPVRIDGEMATIPKPAQIRVSDNELTFSIGQVRSRTPSVMYFKFYAYYYRGTDPIIEYTSPRWVITSEYTLKSHTFNIKEILDATPQQVLNNFGITKLTPEDIDHYYFEIYTLGVNSENPLYMNHIQLNEGEYKEYHQPNDAITDVKVGYNKSYSLNLYDTTDTYLQIIRPNQEDLTTTQLLPSQKTILVPHLPNESSWDNPDNIFYEYMYQTEQRIGSEK